MLLFSPFFDSLNETVEKVPFQKLIIEKWDKNIEKHFVFCVLNNILAIFWCFLSL